MKLYTFGCKDSYSDEGSITIVVADISIAAAKKKAIKLLESKGRKEVIDLLEFKGSRQVPDKGIVYENVEQWREELDAGCIEESNPSPSAW